MIEVAILVENKHKEIKKVLKLITKFSSKIYKPSSYNKIVNKLIYNGRWREASKERLLLE